MSEKWIHINTVTDGEKCDIEGVNIWNSEWNRTGEKIQIKDPLYNQDYNFDVYEIENLNKNIKFAAGEFSNCVWGIYIKK